MRNLAAAQARWLPAIEEEMRAAVARRELKPPSEGPARAAGHYGMMRYHLGWADERLQPTDAPTGKRLRPLVALLVAEALGSPAAPPTAVVPVAAALELLHNFTLVHDDIEDGDATRHHRPTVWSIWGEAQGINAGDGMHVIATLALLDAQQAGLEPGCMLRLARRFAEASLVITEGQHLDLAFTDAPDVSVEEYLDMVERKSAALIGCAAAMGADAVGAPLGTVEAMQAFGIAVGLGFQVRDDVLGMWGAPGVTGKPTSDLVRRKRTLPLLRALETSSATDRLALVSLLKAPGPSAPLIGAAQAAIDRSDARDYCETLVARYSREAQAHLEALPACPARLALSELVAMLEVRDR